MDGAGKSEEVIKRIQQIKKKILCVRGNREEYILEGLPTVVHDEKMKISKEQLERNEWIKRHLSNESIKFIETLPKERMINLFEKKVYMCHYPMDSEKKFKNHIKIANLNENEEMFKDVDANIYLYGHTHIEIYNKNFKSRYINPGALGCPGKTDEAPYGILEINKETISYEQLKIKYDVKEVIKDIEKLSFPGYKHVLKLFYGID